MTTFQPTIMILKELMTIYTHFLSLGTVKNTPNEEDKKALEQLLPFIHWSLTFPLVEIISNELLGQSVYYISQMTEETVLQYSVLVLIEQVITSSTLPYSPSGTICFTKTRAHEITTILQDSYSQIAKLLVELTRIDEETASMYAILHQSVWYTVKYEELLVVSRSNDMQRGGVEVGSGSTSSANSVNHDTEVVIGSEKGNIPSLVMIDVAFPTSYAFHTPSTTITTTVSTLLGTNTTTNTSNTTSTAAWRRELKFLHSNLPDTGVFVLVNEVNINEIVIGMTIENKDSPYYGGIWFFDILIPSNYPNTNPKVQFMTTGYGQVRFNPNLYNCGKVCLSLLGTWSGEPWDPKQSNLTQLIKSILFFIFCEEPYYNEPGYEGMYNTPQGNTASLEYNFSVIRHMITWSIYDTLKQCKDVNVKAKGNNAYFTLPMQQFVMQYYERYWFPEIRPNLMNKMMVEGGKYSTLCSSSVNSGKRQQMINEIDQIDALLTPSS